MVLFSSSFLPSSGLSFVMTATRSFSLYQFNNRHFSIVTLTSDGPQNTAISTITFSVSVRSSLKERMDELLIVNPSHGLSAGVQITSLTQFNHMVDVFSDRTSTDQGCLDPAMSDNFCRKGPEKGLSLIGWLTQLLEPLTVRHLKR
jgi:hypothetical protein